MWAAPYHLDNETFITIGSRLTQGGEAVGSIATGISLGGLVTLRRRARGAGLTVFVLYGDDRVLAHPAMLDGAHEKLLSIDKPMLSVGEIGDPVLAGFSDADVIRLNVAGTTSTCAKPAAARPAT